MLECQNASQTLVAGHGRHQIAANHFTVNNFNEILFHYNSLMNVADGEFSLIPFFGALKF